MFSSASVGSAGSSGWKSALGADLSPSLFPPGKRAYLADYKQLTEASYLFQQFKNIAVKSLLLQGIISGNKYTRHLEREIVAQERGEHIEEFDEQAAKKEFIRESGALIVKNTWTFLIRKVYERIAVCTVDLRLADRLTKDVFKSNLRKLRRFSSSEAANRVFYTGLYSGLLPALSLFSVDCGYGIYDYYLRKRSELFNDFGIEQGVYGLRWVLRRLGLHMCVALCSAGGVACGTRCNWMPKYSTLLIAALFEAIGGEIYNISVGAALCSI